MIDQDIIKLRAQGLTRREIAYKLKVRVGHVKHRIEELHNNGKLPYKKAGHQNPPHKPPPAPPEQDEETKALYGRILKELQRTPIQIHNYFPKNHIKIGLMGDTHLGSVCERIDFLNALYEVYKREGINHVYHCGDIVDGHNIYKGQEFEVYVHGCDDQIKHCVNNYPRIKNMTTHFISGNHDLSFYKSVGVDVGEKIAFERRDFDYLGKDEANVTIQGVTLKLIHPSGGTAYAISYKAQKIVESITGGEKPNILAIGHFHKAEMLPILRNVVTFQVGTLQSQTSFMRRKHTPAHLGGWILEFWVNKKSIVRIKAEFVPFYE